MKGWIAVDLDGTLAFYDHWRGVEHIGEPIIPMLVRVKAWLAEGKDVRIFTARVDGGTVALSMGDKNGEAHRDVGRVRHHIEQWCLKHVGRALPVTCQKDYGMIELWDDRPSDDRPARRGVRRRDQAAARRAMRIGGRQAGLIIERAKWGMPGRITVYAHRDPFAGPGTIPYRLWHTLELRAPIRVRLYWAMIWDASVGWTGRDRQLAQIEVEWGVGCRRQVRTVWRRKPSLCWLPVRPESLISLYGP